MKFFASLRRARLRTTVHKRSAVFLKKEPKDFPDFRLALIEPPVSSQR
jgi:hypothetical protein